MNRIRILAPTAVVFTAFLPGCVTYEPRPLDPRATLLRVDAERRNATVEGDARLDTVRRRRPTTLGDAAAWLREHGPDIRDAAAAYATALARADVPTPLPNPTLQVGPQFGFGSDITRKDVASFGTVGISIPLSDRRVRTDDLNRVRAEVARIDGIARHRELYLELRRRWVRLLTARAIAEDQADLVTATTSSITTARRMVEAGQATALDVALFELERGQREAQRLETLADVAQAEADLSKLTGVHADRFAVTEMPAQGMLPETVPEPAQLRDRLVHYHPGLARLRARYQQSEAALRLEIAKQTPDLTLGPQFNDDVGDSRTVLGLSLGIQLPVFDRNQQAIAQAHTKREEIRIRFEAAANRALAELDRAHRRLQVARQRRATFAGSLLPQARKSIDLARRAVTAGIGDARRLLEAERRYRTVVIAARRAVLGELDAWITLEQAVGTPLFTFPGEREGGADLSPRSLQPSRSTEAEDRPEDER